MRKQIMLSFVFLFSLMTLCQTAFAQFKVDDILNQFDQIDQQITIAMNQEFDHANFERHFQETTVEMFNRGASLHRRSEYSTQRTNRFEPTPQPRNNRSIINTGNAFSSLSQDDRNLYFEFQSAYQRSQDFSSLRIFNGKYSTQVSRVAKAIVEDNPNVRGLFDRYGLLKANAETNNTARHTNNTDSDQRRSYNTTNANNNRVTPNNNRVTTSNQGIIAYNAANDPDSSYNLLNSYEKWVYDSIYSAIANAEPSVTLTDSEMISYLIGTKVISNAIEAIRFDHPEFVWLRNGYKSTYTSTYFDITFYYNSLATNAKQHQREFEEAAANVLRYARQESTLVEQEQYIFSYLVMQPKYEHSDLDQSAYATMVQGASVCTGFAMSFQYFMHQLGIPSYVVRGENHAWNIVEIDGYWYNVDTTPGDNPNLQSHLNKYFNKSLKGFHTTPDENSFPKDRLNYVTN